jgi:hypothetical protein
MCIQQNYTYNSVASLYINEDIRVNDNIMYENIFVNNNGDNIMNQSIDDISMTLPISVADFEYLRIADEIHRQYKHSEFYDNIQYIVGTLLSLYGFYYFISRTIAAIYKKMNY